jgi:CAAX protease family protein
MSSNSEWPGTPPQASPVPVPQQLSVPPENPPWTGWDVARIAAFTLATIFACALLATFGAQRLLYPKLSIIEVARFPLISVLAQLGAYIVVLLFMYAVATRSGAGFWRAVKWNWPRNAPFYLLAGVVFSIGLQGMARVLPMPKTLPIDRFFQTPLEAWVLSIFGTTLAPLLEELFFRGFLYPVLARRAGTLLAIVLTAASFSLIHVPQLARSWGPVLIVFLIGLALTIVRAVTKSVAASVLMHMAYNGTISVLLFIASSGFRHLDKIAP